MEEESSVITFDFIWKCWKTGKYPDGFEDLLQKYLDIKAEMFQNIDIHDKITSWLSKILVAITIGELVNQKRFEPYRIYWENLLGRKWRTSIEDKWVMWNDGR